MTKRVLYESERAKLEECEDFYGPDLQDSHYADVLWRTNQRAYELARQEQTTLQQDLERLSA